MKKILLIFLFPISLFSYEKTVCIDCHLKLEDKALREAVYEWEKSIHAKYDISCHHCHGGNPKDEATAMSPEFGFIGIPKYEEIPEFCGKCHIGVKENYLKSAHSKNLPDGPNCVTCHTYHNQREAGIYLINPDLCGTCHDYERAEKIRSALLSTEEYIYNLTKRNDNLLYHGFNIEDISKKVFSAKNSFRSLTHVIDVSYILAQTESIKRELDNISKSIQKNEDIVKKRKIVGAFVIILFLISACVFGELYKELKRSLERS
ncbi:MAG: cytochrome c3 family protein [Candidatus Hydrothermales bacterium]